MSLKHRQVMFALLALAWTLPVRALPSDPDARAPVWATADLACAAAAAPMPACRDKANAVAVSGNGGELLRGYLRRAIAGAARPLPTPTSAGAGHVTAKGANRTAASNAAEKADALSPVTRGLREVIAAMGLYEGAEVLLALAGGRAPMASPGIDRLAQSKEMAAGFPFDTLSGWSEPLSGIHKSAGAHFDQVLFSAIDPQRQIAWNAVRPESAPDRATAQAAAPGSLNEALAGALAGPGGKLPDLARMPDGKPVPKRRTIIYMRRGRTDVMTIQEPQSK